MSDTPDHTVAKVVKNSREAICILLREFKGRRFIDLRMFAENDERSLVPTKTGISIRPDLLGDVIRGLQEAERQARTAGLIAD